MADLSRFFPGLLGGTAPAPASEEAPESSAPQSDPLATQQSATPGLLNPSALMAPPAPAEQAGGATLLAMLQTPAPPVAAAAPASAPATAGASAPAPTPSKGKAPQGVALARGEAVYEVGAVGASARKQTKVTAITIYNTDPGYRAGRLIAVSARYICYGVRGGSVRVIHQTTGQRLLQKGHTTAELADLSIAGDGDTCTLAAIAGNGDLFVWAISIENMTEVKATELFRRDGGAHGFSRVLWHPTLPLLATGSSGSTAKVCVWKELAAGAEPVCQEMPAGHTGAVTGLSWVPGAGSGNGLGLASAAADGKVVLCDGAGSLQASFAPFGGEPVQAVLVAQPKGQASPLLITGSANNTCLKLWDSTGTKCLHTLTFAAPGTSSMASPELFRATVDLDPYSDFVLLANTVTAGSGDSFAVFTLHINTEGDVPCFDFLCEFGVVYPVLSCVVQRDCTADAEENVRQREMHLYCLQTKAIQQYHLRPDQCCDAPTETNNTPLVTMSDSPAAPEPRALPMPKEVPPAEAAARLAQPAVAAPTPPAVSTPPPSQDDVDVDNLLRQAMSAVPAQLGGSQGSLLSGGGVGSVDGATLEALLAHLQQTQAASENAIVSRLMAANDELVAKVEAENKLRRQKDREEMKKSMEALVTKLSAQMEEKLTKAVAGAVAKEVSTAIKTHLPAALDSHTKTPQYLEAEKAAFNAAVTPAMDKAVKSSADKVVAGIKPALQESFKASFQASIIPAFESSCQAMFSQIHATFERGQAQQTKAESAQEVALAKLQSLQSAAESLTGKLQQLGTAASGSAASAPSPAGQAPATPAAAAQAAPPQESLEQLAVRLTTLVSQEKYDEVFSQVLSRSDLALVTWLCKKTDPRTVFGKKSLTAPVVLSLVQQLGFDLKSDSALKVQWLRDAVASLDPKDPVVGSHVPVILRDLQLKLAAMERSPAEFPVSQENDFRLLMHVLRSVLG